MSKSKEEIWLEHNNGCTCGIAYTSRKLVAPDCCFHNVEFEPPMDQYYNQAITDSIKLIDEYWNWEIKDINALRQKLEALKKKP